MSKFFFFCLFGFFEKWVGFEKDEKDITGFSISTTGCSYVFCTSKAFYIGN